jgi:rRNA maturation RNase YbeY
MMMMNTDSGVNSSEFPFELQNESGQPVPLDEERAGRISAVVLESESPAGAAFVELVYVDEAEIQGINRDHLQHDYVTDIITFSYHEAEQPVETTLFCCAPRISAQAVEFMQSEKTEFERVLIHGLLHACGYNDQSTDEKNRMTELENHYLNQLS